MAQENKSKVSILTNGIIKENPVLRLVLGTTTHLYLSNFFFITASFHDILKETAVITYGKTKKIYYQAQ